MNSESEMTPSDTILHRIGFSEAETDLALEGNPSAEFMKKQVEISRLEKQLEQSKMLPDFSIGYFSQTMQGVQEINGLPRTFDSGDRFTGIQAGIEIPLWFVPYKSKAKAAKLNEQVVKTNAEYYSKSVANSYNSMLGELAKFSKSLDYYEKQAIPEAEIIIDQATKSYNAGAMDYLDYVQNLNRALDIKLNYLDALNSYNQTVVDIEFITGKTF